MDPTPPPLPIPAGHIVETVREPLLVLAADLRVQRANRSFYRTFAVTPQETEGRLIYELGNGQWDIPALRRLLEDVLPQQEAFDDFEVAHDFPSVGRKVMLLNARSVVGDGAGRAGAILLAIEDITERRRLEDERRELETRFTSLVKNVRDHSIFTLDPHGHITSWNVEAGRILGFGEAEVLGRHFSIIFTDEDKRDGIPEHELRTALSDGRAEDERWHVRKGGERFWALGIVTPTHDAGGGHTGFSKILRDMTERKRAEEQRQELLARAQHQAQVFDTALSHINDFAYTFDRDGRFTYVNRPLLDLWRLKLDQAVGKNFFDLKYPDDLAAKLQRQIQEVIDTKQTVVDETPYTSPTGVPGFYEYIFSPVLGPDGSVEVVAGSTRVITARKQLEVERERLLSALGNERARLAAVIEQAPAFICTLRGPDHVFELANERYYEIVGRRDIIGKTLRDGLPELEGQGFFELLDDVYRTGKTFEGSEMPVLLRRRRDETLDRRFMNLVYQALREADGEISGIFVHGVDVTEMVLAREALREAKEAAESANTAKDRFLAVVSHELRTPLSAILIYAKLLRDGRMEGHARSEALDSIVRSAEAQRQLIEDLLDVSRVVSGKLRLDVREADLAAVVRAAMEVVRPMAEAKDIDLQVSLDARVRRVRLDPERIQQVVWNLLSNAVKFTGNGGRVRVGLRRLDGAVEIQVSDTGRGIKAEFLPHVFELFRQEDASSTRAVGGLGLGLSISRQLVELHAGTIRAESAGEAAGATFTVTLPLAAGAPSRPAEARGDASDAGGDGSAPSGVLAGIRVLVVEDDAAMRTAVRWLLEQSAAEVTAVGSADEALAAFAESLTRGRRFTVLASDIGMPGKNGYELIGEVRRIERGRGEERGIPAVALSAYAREEDRNEATAAGFEGHVAKPVEPAALVEAVARLAGRTGG